MVYVPVPPSLNKLWISTAHGRVRSPVYRTWAKSAGWEVLRQTVGLQTVTCRYNMEIRVPVSRRDTGNWEKAIGDLLESVGIVSNDGNVHSLLVTPMERTDCMVALWLLPEMGGVRKKPQMRIPRTRAGKKRAAFGIGSRDLGF